MKKYNFMLLFYLMFGLSFLQAHPTQISSFSEIAEELKNTTESTLIVFDVDEVLITTEDHFIHPYSDHVFTPLFDNAMKNAQTAEEKKRLDEKISLIFLHAKRVLIEKEISYLLQELQNKSIKVIALTSCATGPIGFIPKLEQWRIDDLNSFHINFSSSFPLLQRQYITEIECADRVPPLYEEGILFSKGYTKGTVLAAFFKQCAIFPKKVIFIDDLKENLSSVESALKELSIEFVGYHYSGAKRHFRDHCDPEVLEYQFLHLMAHDEWLSDTEVEKRLNRIIN